MGFYSFASHKYHIFVAFAISYKDDTKNLEIIGKMHIFL